MKNKTMTAILAVLLLLSTLGLIGLLVRYAASDVAIRTDELVSGMSLEEKVGQLFMTGFAGENSTEAAYRINSFHNGGFIIFKENVVDEPRLKSLISILRSSGKALPLMIAIDHEGGKVNRITRIIGPETSFRQLVLHSTPEKAYERGEADADILKRLGINVNFAPVLDVRTNQDERMLLERSFGDDPDLVTDYGIHYMQGLEKGGVAAVVKHFPGHGSVAVDSHYALPVVEASAEELDTIDIKPFRAAVDVGAGAVMVGHLLVRAYDRKNPASLSPAVIDGLLRGGLGFKGVVFTDDLAMGALKDEGSPGSIAVRALRAGNDVLLSRWTVTQEAEAYDAVLKAARDGELSDDELDAKVRRVVSYKLRYLAGP